MSLPHISPSQHLLLAPEPLTPSSFSTFGTAVLSPLPQHLTTVPTTPPPPLYAPHQPNPVSANQSTALKTSPISPLVSNYPVPSPANDHAQAKGLMSIFSCFPRRNTYLVPNANDTDSPPSSSSRRMRLRLKLEILERHPYTTQTFCPFNHSTASAARANDKTYFIVIVAPTRSDPTATPPNPPDLSRLRAFVVPVADGAGMAVTYNAGTWHAPMVVVGARRVDFLVTQFANGRGADDCQEVLVGNGQGGHVVEVDLSGLGLGEGSENNDEVDGGLWRGTSRVGGVRTTGVNKAKL